MSNINMWEIEEGYYAQCVKIICGVDEAGRGPLAGPVVAGAVILPPDCEILYLNDSKKLSEKKREELYDVIMEQAIAVGVGMASPQRIDEINILQATYEAMREAISKLSIKPDILLNDAVTIPGVDIRQVPIIKGDAKSISIAAASIIAKVYRDKMMDEYAKEYPQYGFEKHKGYGTAAVKLLIQYAKDSGRYKSIGLLCGPKNCNARHIYDKLGFQPTGEICYGDVEMRLEL